MHKIIEIKISNTTIIVDTMKNYHRTIVHLLRCRGHSSDTNQTVNKFSRCNENDITFITGKWFPYYLYEIFYFLCKLLFSLSVFLLFPVPIMCGWDPSSQKICTFENRSHF